MNFVERRTEESVEFPLTPMIDIVFLLLTFFVLTYRFYRQEAELNLVIPTAEHAQEEKRTLGEVIINVRADGTLVLNRQELTLDELRARLQRLREQFEGQAVIIRGDAEASHRHIMAVLDACAGADIWNVSFAAIPRSVETPTP